MIKGSWEGQVLPCEAGSLWGSEGGVKQAGHSSGGLGALRALGLTFLRFAPAEGPRGQLGLA